MSRSQSPDVSQTDCRHPNRLEHHVRKGAKSPERLLLGLGPSPRGHGLTPQNKSMKRDLLQRHVYIAEHRSSGLEVYTDEAPPASNIRSTACAAFRAALCKQSGATRGCAFLPPGLDNLAHASPSRLEKERTSGAYERLCPRNRNLC